MFRRLLNARPFTSNIIDTNTRKQLSSLSRVRLSVTRERIQVGSGVASS